jgi:hypothetical protein
MARYAAFTRRDLTAALCCAKRAGIPIHSIKFNDDKGFEIIVGEPEIAEVSPPPKRSSWDNVKPIDPTPIRERRRRIVTDAIASLRAEGHPIGVGVVVDFLTSGKRKHPKSDIDDILSLGDGIGWHEALARLVERELKKEIPN